MAIKYVFSRADTLATELNPTSHEWAGWELKIRRSPLSVVLKVLLTFQICQVCNLSDIFSFFKRSLIVKYLNVKLFEEKKDLKIL